MPFLSYPTSDVIRQKAKALVYISAVAAGAFIALAFFVLSGASNGVDQATLTAINQLASPTLDAFFVAITQFGGVIFVILATLVLTGYFLYTKAYRRAAIIAAGVGGAALASVALKLVFERPRPDLWEWIVTETSFSFPSGHSVASASLAISLMIVFWYTKWRTVALIGGAFYVALVGFSRMYLGVHYPTDVIGGWLLALVWMPFIAAALYFSTARRFKGVKK